MPLDSPPALRDHERQAMWGAAMDVGGWLRGLGLEQYEANFRDNKVDAAVLPQLTADDLKDIGVVAVGDRRKLLAAIAALPGAPPPPGPPASAPKPSTPKSGQVSAERRPITVMFCDLVGSTALAATLDPEDWRNLVNAYLDEASAAVTALGGHVLKKLGDGLMALFGYPSAQENDAERAVRAALAIQRALAEINARNAGKGAPQLSARIGLDSGPVVVEAAGEVFGDAPNVAARVQALAEPGSVLATANVQRQVSGLFVAQEEGARELKGVTEPVQLFRIVRASGGGRRGGARTLTPFVGRGEELGLIARRWDRARAGEGQLVMIVGEPGLGKSRLVEEFRAGCGEAPHTWVEWSASQLLQNTPLHPIAEWGRLRFGADAPADQRLADLENTLRLIGLDPVEHAPLLAPLMDIPLPPGRVASFPPEELRRRQLTAMTNMVLAGARSQPAVVAFEDLHWADPTSLDLLRALADRGAQAPLLLLATTRPEFRPPWSLRSHHSVISLSPLDRAGVAHMVGEISARHALSKEVIDGVSERTGGVPLFVEEVTRLLLERGEQGGVQAIPPTLQQSLAARLDRLGPAREVAQIGAVLGRDFAYTLLRDVAELDEMALQASLDRLAEADLLYAEGAPPQANYRFKHALIQDAAYESLLKSRRQALHRRAAELLRDDPVRSTAQPEVIAHHFTQAGLDDLGIEWWGRAGDQALRRSAFQEAIVHLGKAIEMADKAAAVVSERGGEKTAASSQRMKLQSDYGQALRWSKGFAATETKAAFDRAAELTATTEDFSERFAALNGQWTLAQMRGELRKAHELASAFLREAESAGRVMEAGVAHRGLAFMSYFAGDFLGARIHCEQALATCSPDGGQEARERSGEDTEPVAMAMLALTSWQLGEVDRARELIEAANRRAAEIGHFPSMAIPLQIKTHLEILRGDPSAALAASKPLDTLSREHGMALQHIWAELNSSWAHGRLHDPQGGAAASQRALAALIESGDKLGATFYVGLVAQLEAEGVGVETALARLDQALDPSNQSECRHALAFLHRLRGDLLLKRNPGEPSLAEGAYRAAIAVAKEQGSRSHHLQAALPLAKLYQSTGRPAEAHAILAPALEGFSPTPEMPQLAEAEALLAGLEEADEIKADAAQRERRLRLQTSYGRAQMMASGFAAEETRAAFARAAELVREADDVPERLATIYGQFGAAATAGELRLARELAAAAQREARNVGRIDEAERVSWLLGMVDFWRGNLVEARTHYERALAVRDRMGSDDRERYGDVGAQTAAAFASTLWQLGELDRARDFVAAATRRASEVDHGGSLADTLFWKSYFEVWRGDPLATLSAAEALEALAREHGALQYLNEAELHSGWARGRMNDPAAGAAQIRRVLAAFVDQGVKVNLGFYTGLLAQLEAETLGAESALARIDEAFRLSNQVEHGCSLPFLHRLRGEMLLRRDPADPVGAEDAFRTSIAIAKQQGARSPVLLASLALAKLLQSKGHLSGAYAVLAPALEDWPSPLSLSGEGSGVRAPADLPDAAGPSSPALLPEGKGGASAEMPELAEAQALLAALAQSDGVKADAARRERRAHLQTAYSQAMMWSKGAAAEETKAALARAVELAGGTHDISARFAALEGQFRAACTEGKLRSARELALAFLAEAEEAGRVLEAGSANNVLGIVAYWQGDFVEARARCERSLDACSAVPDPKDREFSSVYALSFLALTLWQLGEVERARELTDGATQRATEIADIPAILDALFYKSYFELWRGDPLATLSAAEALEALAREHGALQYLHEAELLSGWARGRIVDPKAGAAQVQRVLAAFVEQGVRVNLGLYTGLLAELEAETLGADSALARIDEAFRLSNQVEHGCSLPFLHRLRGDILLKCEPADPVGAEEAFRKSIAIAKQQGARSPVLLASLALAKLLQSNGRPVEAHAVLAPALEGWPSLLPRGEGGRAKTRPDEGPGSLTPDLPRSARGRLSPVLRQAQHEGERGDAAHAEMPELREAEALLAALAETEEVKAESARRERRLHLQTAYGQAMMHSRGFGSDESKTAFARARTLVAGAGDASERFDAYYGLFIGSLLRGELGLARETAESFLREAETEGRMTEAAVARRNVGITRLYQGDLIGAATNLAAAVRTYDPERDRDAKFRFGMDTAAAATSFLALGSWARGDVERARSLSEEALAGAEETAHAPTRAIVYHHIALYHVLRGDPEAVTRAAKIPVDLGREHEMALYLSWGEVLFCWARARLGDRESGMTGLADALAEYVGQGNKLFAPIFQGLLAELEAEGQDDDGALRRIDEALALASETGQRWTDAMLHRLRGEILLKRDPANTARAEEAFLAAIAVAHEQGARSFELRAALSLAKLYQSTGRPAEARAILSQALEGWPTLLPPGEGVARSATDEGAGTLTPDPSPARERGDALAAEMPQLAEAQALLAALA